MKLESDRKKEIGMMVRGFSKCVLFSGGLVVCLVQPQSCHGDKLLCSL